ncbi:uncharacterized protein LOC106764439 [Vigna radiata var. radiata]|uniref:Uncharacterized protein LOC106764439 n=1 Tax=Vigna radiata var. radiata TaxID=3916 RepID=A0A1S3UDU5_VIGRR|nr:uncharacterized protein LOC106764439 [Vigna radiata var. radiata]
MKLLISPSYSSTPSSSSTLSLDPSLCNSKSATAGCLTAILRRILCSGGLPTHPSDQLRELDSMSKMGGKVQELKTKPDKESTTTTTITPGLVERLMGLEPMGERERPIESSSSLSRSKSMNSVDYLGECKRMEGLQNHAKSSSFREFPTMLENENFLVLSFERGCDDGEFRSKERKKEKGLKDRGEFKRNKREKVHDEKGNLSDMSSANVGNDGEHKIQFANTSTLFMAYFEKEYLDSETAKFSHNMNRKEVTNGEKVKRRKKGTTCYAEKKVDTECGSEDSSPVSIFDFEREAPGTGVDSFGVDTSWRRKLSPELENDKLCVLNCDSNMMIEEMNKLEGSKRTEKQSQDCVDIWGEICRLVEGEMESNKLETGLKKQGDFECLCADFESEIFDQLLQEFILDQLAGNPLKALQLQNL